MVQRQAGLFKLPELRGNFPLELLSGRTGKEVEHPRLCRVGAEPAGAIHQERRLFRAQGAVAAEQGQVKSHPQGGVPAGKLDRGGGGRLIDHQAGAGQYPAPVSFDNRLIGRGIPAKIIGIDNQPSGWSGSHQSPFKTP